MDIKLLVARLLPITALSASLVFAAPYSTTYSGNYSRFSPYYSSTPGSLPDTGTFTLTLVMDNGGSSPASQVWSTTNLICSIWSFNGNEAVFASNLILDPPQFAAGTASTDASGTMTGIFTELGDREASAYTSDGFDSPLIERIAYFAFKDFGSRGIFFDGGDSSTDYVGAIEATPTSVGILSDLVNWSSATPYSGDCVAAASPTISPGVLWFITRGTQFDEE